MPIRPRRYYRHWQLPPPEVIRDHVPQYLRPPHTFESRESGFASFSDATHEARRSVRYQARTPRKLKI